MRVLAAACRFLGRLLFLLGLSLRGRQPANRIFIVPDGAIQGVLSSGKDEPNRPQPKQGCLSLHPGVQLHLQVVDAHLQRSNPFSWLELFPESVSASLALSIIVSLSCPVQGLEPEWVQALEPLPLRRN